MIFNLALQMRPQDWGDQLGFLVVLAAVLVALFLTLNAASKRGSSPRQIGRTEGLILRWAEGDLEQRLTPEQAKESRERRLRGVAPIRSYLAGYSSLRRPYNSRKRTR
jgi:hypothetical protein